MDQEGRTENLQALKQYKKLHMKKLNIWRMN